jgi:hypothetical protein
MQGKDRVTANEGVLTSHPSKLMGSMGMVGPEDNHLTRALVHRLHPVTPALQSGGNR